MKRIFCMIFLLGAVANLMAQTDGVVGKDIENKGFEKPSLATLQTTKADPENWFLFASTEGQVASVTDMNKHNGMQALLLKSIPVPDAYHGVAQKFVVEQGFTYRFGVSVINDSSEPLLAPSFGQISIEWQNAAGTEISRTHGPTFAADQLPAGKWEKFFVDAVPPADAKTGVVVITVFTQAASQAGIIYVDDVELVKSLALK